MRIGSMAPQAAAAMVVSRDQRRAARPSDADRPALPARSTLSAELPTAVADRLADLMASDPGLAEAVSAQLPAARLRSASDLAAYAAPGTTRHALDVAG